MSREKVPDPPLHSINIRPEGNNSTSVYRVSIAMDHTKIIEGIADGIKEVIDANEIYTLSTVTWPKDQVTFLRWRGCTIAAARNGAVVITDLTLIPIDMEASEPVCRRSFLDFAVDEPEIIILGQGSSLIRSNDNPIDIDTIALTMGKETKTRNTKARRSKFQTEFSPLTQSQ